MKAFLLAAGFGTRLRPLTDTMPKCLLPIRGTPILQIWLALCRKFGIDELLINLHSHADTVRRFVEQHDHSVKIRLYEETTLLGSAGTILANQDWVKKENSFWVLYADVLTAANLAQMLDFHRQHSQIVTIGVYEVPNPSRCGIVQVDESGIVWDFVEKPKEPKGNLAFSGLMLAKPAVIELIPNTGSVDWGFHVLPKLVGKMTAYRIPEFLMDIGTLDAYATAQRSWPGLSRSQETR